MKKYILTPVIFSILCFAFQACSKSNSTKQTKPVDVPSLIVSGTWNISSYTQRDEVKTGQFQGYHFTFARGGMLTAEKDGVVTTGTWSHRPAAVVYYGASGSKESILIGIGSSEPLSRLSKTWNVDSLNTTTTKLALVSPEVAEQEHLIFSKD